MGKGWLWASRGCRYVEFWAHDAADWLYDRWLAYKRAHQWR
jgi:hypothetical protein